MQFKRTMTWIAIFAVMLAVLPGFTSTSPAAQQSKNLLTNPGFEGEFVKPTDDFQVAAGWTAWWIDQAGQKRPNYESTNHPDRVHGGATAQSLASFFGVHVAGVYQQVNVTPGDDLRFSAYGKGWTSSSDNPLNVSVNGSDLRMRIGVDPFGGTDPNSSNVTWSQAVNAADSWVRFEVYTKAQSAKVTVFVYSAPSDSRRHNDVYWDDAELVALSGDAAATAQAYYPTPTPVPIIPTATPVTVALGQNLLKNPGFEGSFYNPCSWKADPVPWNHIPCDPWYEELMRRWNTVLTPQDWVAWWREPITDTARSDFYTYPNRCPRGAPEGCVPWHNPEYGGTDWIINGPSRIHSGKNSLRYFTFWSVHEGGVFQTIGGITPGTQLRFSAYMEAWSARPNANNEEPSPFTSGDQTSMHMKIGIDPTGGRDPFSSSIVWSAELDSYDRFSYYQVTAVAQSSSVTVYIYSRPEKDNKHNDLYVDDTELVAVSIPGGIAAPPPAPPAAVQPDPNNPAPAASYATTTPMPDGSLVHTVVSGDTLFGLSLEYGVSMDQIMQLNGITQDALLLIGQNLVIALPSPSTQLTPQAAATAEVAPRPTPQPAPPTQQPAGPISGKLCIRAFDDTNADQVLGAGESLVMGVVFILQDNQNAIVATRTTDGGEPYCFEESAGNYSLRIQTPAGRMATSDTRWGVAIGPGTQIDVNYGSRASTAGAGSVTLRAPESESDAGKALSALLGVGLLAAAGGLAWFAWMRRRAT